MKSRCFKLYRAYSISFTSSNVSKCFWSWILKTVTVSDGKEMYEAWCTCKVVVKSIAFLRPQRGFPNMLLRNMNIHEHWTRELSVSNPYEFPFTTNMTDCQVFAAMWQCVEVCSIRVRWSETLIGQQGVENTSHRPFNKEGKTETRRKTSRSRLPLPSVGFA